MKNIKTMRIISSLIFILVVGVSCKDEFLDEYPKNAISEGIYWQSEKDAHQALMGVYTTYADRYAERVGNLDKSMVWMSAYAGYGSWRTFGYSRDVEIEPTHGTVTNMWRKLYIQISRANYFLDNIGDVDMDATKKSSMTAEVRFLRAFSYFWLSQLYGNVPLVDKVLTFDEANTVSQSSEEEVGNFILAELTDISSDLPVEQPSAEKGRIERGAALALMGRVLMAKKRWTEAADVYKNIMNLNRYEIDPRYKELFEDGGEDNAEFIFVNKYMENEFGETMSQHTMRSSLYGGYNACNVFQHFVDKFLMTDGKSTDDSEIFDSKNPFENRDPRLYATLLLTGYSSVFGEIFKGDPATIALVGQTGPNISGYLLQKFWDREYEGNRQYYGADYPQMRYAEVLLSRLESELEAGNDISQELLDNTINKVRQREEVDMPIVTEKDPDLLRDIIMRERAVELAFEGGITYYDLRRWGKLQQEVDRDILGLKITDNPQDYDGLYNINEDGYLYIGHLRFYDYNYLWPIPLSELDVNKNLKQNPGYN